MTEAQYLCARGWAQHQPGQWYKDGDSPLDSTISTEWAVALQVEEDIACDAFVRNMAESNPATLVRLRAELAARLGRAPTKPEEPAR